MHTKHRKTFSSSHKKIKQFSRKCFSWKMTQNCLNFLQFSRKPKTVTFGKYLVSLIGDFFAFIESVRLLLLLLLTLSLSRIGWNLGFFTRGFGIEETRVVRRRRNPKPGVWAVQCSNRVDENRVRVFEPVDTGIKERW